jgi:biotin carboxyl carrier protein
MSESLVLPSPPATLAWPPAAAADQPATDAAPLAPPAVRPDRAALSLALQAVVLSHAGCAAAASAFASELATAFGCTRVTVGFVRRGYARLAALSHGPVEGLHADVFDPIAAAMDEAIEQGQSLWLPADADAPSAIRLAHGHLQQRQGGAVGTVPLMYLGESVGAIGCEWAATPAQLSAMMAELEDLINLVGPVLHLLHLGERPLAERARDGLRRGWQGLLRPQGARRRQALVASLVALLALLAVPVPYLVGGKARVEGQEQRLIVAPTDGFLKATRVRPGDRVQAGEVLVEMADQDLQLQRRRWVAEQSQQESAYATALARSDRSAMVIALARVEEARSQLALVDADLARASIAAPFAGTVIDGDLSQALGAPVERGKVLMTIVPGDQHRVVIDIDERDIADVRAGQAGSLALSALPWDSLPIRVQRVTPVARTVDGSNVFEVEADIADGSASIRPGLEGVAKIRVGRQPIAWTALHRLTDWLRVACWSWLP